MIFEDRGRKKANFYGSTLVRDNNPTSPESQYSRGIGAATSASGMMSSSGQYSPNSFQPYDGAKQYSLERGNLDGPQMQHNPRRIEVEKKKQEYYDYCKYMMSLNKQPKSEQQYNEDMMSLERRPDTREIKKAKQRIYAEELQSQIDEKRSVNKGQKLNPLTSVQLQGAREGGSPTGIHSNHNFYSTSSTKRKRLEQASNSIGKSSMSPIQGQSLRRSSGFGTPTDYFSGKKVQPLKDSPLKQQQTLRKKQQDHEDRTRMDQLFERQQDRQMNREYESDRQIRAMDEVIANSSIIRGSPTIRNNNHSTIHNSNHGSITQRESPLGNDRIGKIAQEMLLDVPGGRNSMNSSQQFEQSLQQQNEELLSQLEVMQQQLALQREQERAQEQLEEERLRKEHEKLRREMEEDAIRRKKMLEEQNARILEKQRRLQQEQQQLQEQQQNILKKNAAAAAAALKQAQAQAMQSQNSSRMEARQQQESIDAMRREMTSQMSKINEDITKIREDIKKQSQITEENQLEASLLSEDILLREVSRIGDQIDRNQEALLQALNPPQQDAQESIQDQLNREMMSQSHATHKLLQDLSTSIEKKDLKEEMRYQQIKKSVHDLQESSNNSTLLSVAAKQSLHLGGGSNSKSNSVERNSGSISSTASTLRKRQQQQQQHLNQSPFAGNGFSPEKDDENIFEVTNFTQNFYVNGTPGRNRAKNFRLPSFLNLKESLTSASPATNDHNSVSAGTDANIFSNNHHHIHLHHQGIPSQDRRPSQNVRIHPKVQLQLQSQQSNSNNNANMFTPRNSNNSINVGAPYKPSKPDFYTDLNNNGEVRMPSSLVIESPERVLNQHQRKVYCSGHSIEGRSKSSIDRQNPITSSSRLSEYLNINSPNKRRIVEPRMSLAQSTPSSAAAGVAAAEDESVIFNNLDIIDSIVQASGTSRTRSSQQRSAQRYQSLVLKESLEKQQQKESADINPNYNSLFPSESPRKSNVFKVQQVLQQSPNKHAILSHRTSDLTLQNARLPQRTSVAGKLIRELDGIIVDVLGNPTGEY